MAPLAPPLEPPMSPPFLPIVLNVNFIAKICTIIHLLLFALYRIKKKKPVIVNVNERIINLLLGTTIINTIAKGGLLH